MSITLTGTFTRLDGSPATGTVRVTPSRSPIMDSAGRVVISGPQVFPLDKDGKLTTEIPASNDPDLGPAFTYAIDVNLTHASWKISKVWIPHGSTTVDLSEIGDYTPVPGVATRTVTIPADGTDGQVLVWDGAGFAWDDPPRGPEGPRGPQGPAVDIDTGLPIIVNTTVGTRVFIGGHMVHGDTGWRTITSWDETGTITGQALSSGVAPTTGVAGWIRIRREADSVAVAFFGLTFQPGSQLLITLPAGFTPGRIGSRMPIQVGDTLGLAAIENDANRLFVAFSQVASNTSSTGRTSTTIVRMPTTSGWPTTLPGLPG